MSHERTEIDWLACELIEQVPGKVSGRPIVRGTRVLPDAIVNSFDAGDTLEEIQEDYPGLDISQIRQLIEFAHRKREQPVLSNEQNIGGRKIAMVVLSAIEWHIIRHSSSVIQSVVEAATPGSYQTMEYGMFSRRAQR